MKTISQNKKSCCTLGIKRNNEYMKSGNITGSPAMVLILTYLILSFPNISRWVDQLCTFIASVLVMQNSQSKLPNVGGSLPTECEMRSKAYQMLPHISILHPLWSCGSIIMQNYICISNPFK